jgi:two-component system, sensor histidine kinase and response regulator
MLAVARQPRVPARRPAAEQPATDVGSVLVVDDDPAVRRMLARALRHHGLRVREAAGGSEALELAAAEAPHLVIVDLRMPGVSGFEVVETLKQRYETAVPVIVLSGVEDPADRVRAFEAGADDFVAKPVFISEFLKRVDAFERTRRALQAAREANARTDRLRMFVSEAAALLAHDLNNGLSIANANLQFLDEELELDGDLADAMAGSQRALHRMSTLVRNFVDISRLEDDAIQPQRTQVDIDELLHTVARVHDHARTGSARRIRIECPARLCAWVDPMLLERILHNLLNNAVRYVDAGGRILVRAALEGGELVIGVGNTGAAIPGELQATLFTKYSKGQDGRAQRGMGLYFCRLASEAHGGRIGLETDPDCSTYFAVRLPAA